MGVPTETDVANAALSLISDATISTLDDATAPARLCKLFLPLCRKRVLREGQFNFAVTRSDLPKTATSPKHKWSYEFSLPGDYLRALLINEDPKIEFEVTSRVLRTDEETVELKYVFDEPDYSKWDDIAISALYYLLAARLALPITRDKDVATLMLAQYNNEIEDAMEIDSQESGPTVLVSDDLIDPRGVESIGRSNR